jgi:hypothetical protein
VQSEQDPPLCRESGVEARPQVVDNSNVALENVPASIIHRARDSAAWGEEPDRVEDDSTVRPSRRSLGTIATRHQAKSRPRSPASSSFKQARQGSPISTASATAKTGIQKPPQHLPYTPQPAAERRSGRVAARWGKEGSGDGMRNSVFRGHGCHFQDRGASRRTRKSSKQGGLGCRGERKVLAHGIETKKCMSCPKPECSIAYLVYEYFDVIRRHGIWPSHIPYTI